MYERTVITLRTPSWLRRFWAVLTLAVLLMTALPAPVQAALYRPAIGGVLFFVPDKPRDDKGAITTVKVGEPFDIEVYSLVGESILVSGQITLESPSGKQKIVLPLERGQYLEARHTFAEGTEPGRWKVREVTVTSAYMIKTTLRYGQIHQPFKPALSVKGRPLTGGGQQWEFRTEFVVEGENADLVPPQLTKLDWTSEDAKAGQPVRITAEATDDAGEVAIVTATIDMRTPYGESLWSRTLKLLRQPSGTWEGTFLAPTSLLDEGAVYITALELADKAGNTTKLTEADIEKHVKNGLVPSYGRLSAKLNPEPYLVNVIHRGAYSFLDWNVQDVAMIGELYDLLEVDTQEARARIHWDLLMLDEAAKKLRSEIYKTPDGQFRFVPLNTSGKWRALDKAFQARLYLLTEAERREAAKVPNFERIDLQRISEITYDPTGYLTAIDPAAYADSGPALMNAVIEALSRSSLPEGLMQAQHMAPSSDEVTLLDRDLIWFQPFVHASAQAQHYDGARETFVYLPEGGTPENLISSVFHELGHHFHDVFVGAMTVIPSRAWKEYMSLRGQQDWLTAGGWSARTQENFAEDFAYAFLPDDLRPGYDLRGSFKPFSVHPEQMTAFVDWITKKSATTPAPVVFGNPLHFQAGVKRLSGSFAKDSQIIYQHFDNPWFREPARETKIIRSDAVSGAFDVPVSLLADRPVFVKVNFQVTTVVPGSLVARWSEPPFKAPDTIEYTNHTRVFMLLPYGLSSTGTAPRVTNSPELPKLAGITNQEQKALAPGENWFALSFDLTGRGDAFRLSVPVYYESTSELPLTASAPPTVIEPELLIRGKTMPRSIIRVGEFSTTSDAYGRYTLLVKRLAEGETTLQVTVTTPSGNSAKTELTVSYIAE